MQLTGEFFGESPGMLAVRDQVARLIARQSDKRSLPPVLIQGETGTGKTLLAKLIHRAGPRAAAPFQDVNCAAIPETLLESEFFGFERGAFTDARQAKAGLFQAANHGTIFLDEIGLLPEALQAKLLKVIEERAVRRLGSTRSEPIDVSIIAASNQELAAAMRDHRFREDLYHRLAVVTVRLPPLRERGQDILLLAERFLGQTCVDYGLPPKELGADARAALLAYPWPGNVRELSNYLERAALLSDTAVITAAILALPSAGSPEPTRPATSTTIRLEETPGSAEREQLLQALERTGWNITRTAHELGISRNTLRYRIEKHGLQRGGSPPLVPAGVPREQPGPQAPSVAAGAPASPIRVRWDRRRVTLLRASVVPSAAAAASYGSGSPDFLVDKAQSFGGRVEELGLTAIVAAFGLEPLEDAPRHAANAAIAMQKAAEHARRDGSAFRIKVGIHVGQFLVAEGGGALQIGLDAKREAWMALEAMLERAEPDTVVATEAAASFLERGFDLVPVGVGAGTAGLVYRLAGRQPSAPGLARPMAPFVGRRQELDLLESRLASTLAGRGQLVGIVGEAGLGKSRLVYEFRQGLRQREIVCLEGRCLSYGSSMPYLPVLEILRWSFGITDTDGPSAVADRVRAGLGAVGMDAEEWGPYLLQILGVKESTERLTALSPDAVMTRTREAIRQLGLQASRRSPIVYVLEDLHWIDRTSEDCMNSLVGSLAGAAIMVLATYRPGYRPGWIDKSYATQIALQPLSEDDSRTVMRSVLRTEPVPDSLARLILDKAEGNPFFLEELSGAVREHGTLEVPDTVEEVLLARIRRLSDGARQALQRAALLGREAPLRLLRSIWDGPEDLGRHLQDLVRLEFLHERTKGGELVHVFKHPLTQEVAYGSLPVDRRQLLHAAAGRALEAEYADRRLDACEQLAHHYARSAEAAKALEYLTLVAQKAASLHAHDEAVRALQEAQLHLQGLPASERDRRRLDLIVRQAAELIPLWRLQEILELLLPQRETLDRLGDPALAAHYHFVLGYAYSFLDRERSVASAAQAIAEADRYGDAVIKGKAHCILGQDGPFAGQALEGIAHGQKALELLEACEERWWLGRAHWVVALNYGQIGAFDEALGALASADAIAEATGDPRLQTAISWCRGILHAARGEVDAGVQACRRALERARDPLNHAMATGWLGFALLEKGEAAEAISWLEQAVGQFRRFSYRPLDAWFTAFLAEAYRMAGRADAAREAAQKSLRVATDAQVRVAVGWARHVLGRIASDIGAPAEAEAHLREALAAFESIHSRYEAARTRLDLAIVTHAQGNKEAARAFLGGAHEQFSTLNNPHWVRRAELLAGDQGIAL